MIGYDGFKRITGTKLHVAVDKTGLPISFVIGPANQHDSTKFIDVMENISDFVNSGLIQQQIVSVYADKGYDSTTIRDYLKNRNVKDCIPKRNYKTNNNQTKNNFAAHNYNKTRFVVKRFFAWLKNGFHRTRIRYERIAENYLAFVNIASIVMYWRVLG